MPITITCPSCACHIKVPESAVGRVVRCPKCGSTMTVGGVTAVPPPVAVPSVHSHHPAPAVQSPAEVMKECPFCGEDVRASAVKCKHCGETINVTHRAAEEARRAAERAADRPHAPNVYMNAGGGGGGASSAASSSAAAASSYGRYRPRWNFRLVGGLVLAAVLGTFCICGSLLQQLSGWHPSPSPTPNATGTLQLQFTGGVLPGTELFVDGKVNQPFNPSNNQLSLTLSPGNHDIALHMRGKEVYSSKAVKVNAADQGVAVLKIPAYDDPDAEGTLQLEIKGVGSPGPSFWWKNLELFIDDLPQAEINAFGGDNVRTYNFKLAPKDHTIVLKKNGIEVYNDHVTVKKPTEGTTFASVPLVVTGTVAIRNVTPLGPAAAVFVRVDGKNTKDWPVGGIAVEVPVEVGDQRIIEVVMSKPQETVLARYSQRVEPAKRVELTMKVQ